MNWFLTEQPLLAKSTGIFHRDGDGRWRKLLDGEGLRRYER